MIQKILKEHVLSALKELDIKADQVHFEHPTDLEHGDFSTNVAMVYGKEIGENPKELAEKIVRVIKKNKPEEIESIEVAGPGFINFHLSKEFFAGSVENILGKGENWGKNNTLVDKKVLIEHSSPNLFKPFHIGHVVNNAIGESIVRLMKYAHADVVVMSYPSDVSLGIGKAVWAFLEKGVDTIDTFSSTREKISFLGECYAEGTRVYDEDESTQKKIRDFTKQIYEKTPGPVYDAYLIGRDINLEYFKDVVSKLGSTFDSYIFESEAGEAGRELVEKNVGNIFERSEGAIVYKGEQDGLHTRVFINKEGYPIYEAKDIGLLSLKFERYSPDMSLFVTDNEQGPYFEVVVAAAGKIEKDWKEKTRHIIHGRMQFKGEKMSSRLGNVPLAQDILDVINEEVKIKSEKVVTEPDAEIIAIGALKYTILKSTAGKDMDFDPDISMSFEGASGPYLQYAHTRAKSVLEKAGEKTMDAKLPKGWSTTKLERLLYRFGDVVERAQKEYEPHYVCTYLTELAAAFGNFYANERILDADEKERGYKLALAQAFQVTMKNGLWLLGIKTPEKM